MSVRKQKIIKALKREIAAMPDGKKLPSEVALSLKYHVAKMTASKILDHLVQEQLAIRIPRRGTFVSKPALPPIRMVGTNFLPLIRAADLPDSERIQPVGSVNEEFEICRCITNYAHLYEDYFEPFPDEMIRRLKSANRFFPFIYNVHSKHGKVYALPFRFSPILLTWNREIMRKIDPLFNPMELTAEGFLELCKKADELGYGGFSTNCFRAICRCAMMAAARKYKGKTALRHALDTLIPWLKYRSSAFAFLDNNILFTLSARRNIASLMQNGIKFELAPMLLFFGSREQIIISDSLAVSRNARNKEELFRFCENMLSPKMQEKIREDGTYLPVDCLQSSLMQNFRTYRDDLFFTGLKNVSVMNQFYPQSFNIRLHDIFNSFFRDEISDMELREQILKIKI